MRSPIFKNRPNPVHIVNGKEVYEHRSSATVAIILALYKDHIYVLAEKRSANMPYGAGLWVAPGGFFDYDEDGWDSLRRETYEETSFLIDDYEKHIIFDNDKEPFYVRTSPDENRQNIVLNYCIVFDFEKLPIDIEQHTNSEVTKVKWILIEDINKYNWAFEHDTRIKMALNKCTYKNI